MRDQSSNRPNRGPSPEDLPSLFRMEGDLKRAFSKEHCLHPNRSECSQKIVKAHTVPRKCLEALAQDGHVYMFKGGMKAFNQTGGRVAIETVGINKATVFTGFCGYHDDSLFAPIEKVDYFPSLLNCFLLAYRSIAREYFMKSAQHALGNPAARVAQYLNRQLDAEATFIMDAHFSGIALGLDDISYHKGRLDALISSNDYSEVEYTSIEIDGSSPIMASFSVYPEFDFNGRQIQDPLDVDARPAVISTAIFSTQAATHVVFSWLSSDKVSQDLVRSLITKSNDEILEDILKFSFESSDNVSISPTFWNSISVFERKCIEDWAMEGLSFDEADQAQRWMRVRGKWSIKSIKSNWGSNARGA